MKVNNRLIAILTIALFAGNILSILPLANATVGGALEILGPDQVAAGGPIFIDATGMTATGGTLYFYLSLDDDPVINSGDIYFGSAKAADAITDEELQTLFLTASVPDEEYYLKCTDIKAVDRDAVVSAETIEVISEDLPSVVNNDPTGNVGDNPEIEITDADAWTAVEFYWKGYKEVLGVPDPDATALLDDGEVTTEAFEVPDAYKGTYKIVVLFTDPDGSYATYVQFTVEPDVDWDFVANPDGLSIEADALDQQFIIQGTGFPEGTIAEDSVTATLKNFMTGSTIEVYDTRHDEYDVLEDPEGQVLLTVTIDAVEAGVLDVKIPVDSSSETFPAAFYSSTPTEEGDFTTITHYKISDTTGQNGDDVTFSFINLGDTAAVTISWIGDTVTKDVVGGNADLNGAYEEDYELDELPGGSYSVRAKVTVGATIRERTIATFTVEPDFYIDQEDANVGDAIDLHGTGFPADATFDTIKVGGADDIDIDVNVLATGEFDVLDVIVPEVSGGGKDVTVKVSGEDADGVAVDAQTTIVIDPMVYDMEAIEFLDGESVWEAVDVGTLIFPGHIMKIYGNGFLAGETLTVTLYDADDDVVGTAVIGDGEKADNDGNVELVAWLPNAKALYPAGSLDCYVKLAGATTTNKDNSDVFDVSASDDANAFILNGIANDGDADIDVKVGDTLRVVGFGFRTKTIDLTLEETDDDIKTVTSVNGFFDTTFTVPALEGEPEDGGHYHVDALDAWSCFYVFPNIALSPSTGYVDSKFTVSGTGFDDAYNFDVVWVGIIGNEVLDTVDGDDVEDGSFSIEVSVPTVVPQSYKVEVVEEGEEEPVWDDAVYTVADKSAVQMNQTLTEILAQLKTLDIATLNTNVQSAVTTANAAKTAADAAKAAADSATSTANAAKASADSAKTAADSAKSAADAATAAANAAKTAADNAASSASGLTTLVYAAIGASLIAALAAIVALMQISRKIA